MSIIAPLVMTHEQEYSHINATICHICGDELKYNKVKNHNHMTGDYIGAAHNRCNLNYKQTKKIPISFYNLKNYDGHLIMQYLGKYKQSRKINCIAKDMEKYISFSIDDLVFLDSYNFLKDFHEKLVSNLTDFRFINNPLLKRKGVYPYEYMTGEDKFKEKCVPHLKAFKSKLTQVDPDPVEYAHAQNIWDSFKIQNLKEYHDLYFKTDVVILADVFETFRDICLTDYKLDPVHMYSFPGLTWEASLKMTGITLELFQDIDMHLFIESAIKGGVSMISTRYAKANNKYMAEEYNPYEESSYLIYLDCNSLYSTAMTHSLPVGEFKWCSLEEYFNNNNNPEYGFILEADLKYGKHLHDLRNDYPLALEKLNGKLIPNLNNNYILHYKTLEKYVELGLVVTKYHRIL